MERGDHAILAIEQHQYDCVLLDRGLQHATGDDILLKVRGKNLSTPVIFLTARDSIRDRVEGLDLGANDYLVKPFSLEELSARIRLQLRQQQHSSSQVLSYANIQLDPQAKSDAIEVFIYQLRKKLGSQCIKTIRGLGYRMNQDT